MRRYLLPLFTLFLYVSLNIQAQDGWLMQDGNPERTAFVDTDMKPPFELSQTLDLTEFGQEFTYAYGMIYFTFNGAEGNSIGTFDPATGDIVWSHDFIGSRGSVGCFPAVMNDIVYASAQQTIGIYALDRMTGDSLWLFPSGSNFGRTFAIKGDRLFAQPSGHGLICLQRDTGTLLWEYSESGSQTVPLVDDKHAYFTSRSHDTIVALTHDGDIAWKYLSSSAIQDSEGFLAHGDTVFFKSRGYLVALNQANGEEFWSTKLASDTSLIGTINPLTWTPEALIVHEWKGDWRGAFMIQGYDLKTGDMLWSHDLKDGSSSPATAFGRYLVNMNERDLQIRQASDGEVVQELTGLRLDNYQRVIVVDGMIMALRGSTIYIFTPVTTGIDALKNLPVDWKILGNPAHEKLTIEITSENPDNVSYRVIGIDGKTTSVSGKIFTHEKSRVDIDVSSLPTGNYIIQLLHNGQSDQKLFIITDRP